MNFNQWFELLPDGKKEVLRNDKWMLANAAFDAGQSTHPSEALPEPVKLQFPTMLRKMWSGGEVQKWIDEQGLLYASSPKAGLPEPVADGVFCWYRHGTDETGEGYTAFSEDDEKPHGTGWKALYTSPARVPDGFHIQDVGNGLTIVMDADDFCVTVGKHISNTPVEKMLLKLARALIAATPSQHGECGSGKN